jgi:hypothetical protein
LQKARHMIATEILRFLVILFGLSIAVIVVAVALLIPELIESIKALYDALSE